MSEITQQTESLAALAEDIKARHETCQLMQGEAVEFIGQTITARVEVSRLVETAHSIMGGAAFVAWWRDLDMPHGWAGKYLRLAKTADRCALGDKSQLRLCGILPEAEPGNDGQRREANPWQWTGYVGKIRASLTPERISSMGSVDREVALQQVEPLLEQMQGIVRELRGDAPRLGDP
jgi:hypothetical protein